MKKILAVLVILVGGYLSHLFLPWWIIWLVCAIVFFVFKNPPGVSFSLSFIAAFLLWFLLALNLDVSNHHLLSGQIGELFGGLSSFSLCLVTGLIGGLTGALGGLTASIGRKIIVKS